MFQLSQLLHVACLPQVLANDAVDVAAIAAVVALGPLIAGTAAALTIAAAVTLLLSIFFQSIGTERLT